MEIKVDVDLSAMDIEDVAREAIGDEAERYWALVHVEPVRDAWIQASVWPAVRSAVIAQMGAHGVGADPDDEVTFKALALAEADIRARCALPKWSTEGLEPIARVTLAVAYEIATCGVPRGNRDSTAARCIADALTWLPYEEESCRYAAC